MKFAVTCI